MVGYGPEKGITTIKDRFRTKKEQLETFKDVWPESGLDCLICATFARQRLEEIAAS